ncbi:hypothetical protein [uncultured Cloacibacillus sp.]|uniref:hypothetical protein n=1 Tax=uncultured Cloacibacillus sp. TaxID=889794 RepID=UPI003209432A
MYRSPEKIADYLENWIRERFKEAKAERAVLGISGGIDSALLAALLAKALGPENVTGVMMPCHSMPIDEEYAALLADAIKVKRRRSTFPPFTTRRSPRLRPEARSPTDWRRRTSSRACA